MSKRSIAMTAALLVVALIAGIGPAEAHKSRPVAPSRTKTIEVRSHYTEPAGDEAGAKCLGGATSTPECRVLFGGDATVTGTMWGDEEYDLSGGDPSALSEGKIAFEGTMYMNGGVEGCGTGTYILEATEGYIDMTTYDPLTDSAEGFTKWRLRPGSGTGELTNLVSGSGELHGEIHWAGGNAASITPHFGEGDITGTITCRR
ncbi:MAG TPA: hypothetical protein VMZ22_03495 [Acidimicrobiales bacterium]|nr:hypothetical protein [Acidimicrobiales bacterium]